MTKFNREWLDTDNSFSEQQQAWLRKYDNWNSLIPACEGGTAHMHHIWASMGNDTVSTIFENGFQKGRAFNVRVDWYVCLSCGRVRIMVGDAPHDVRREDCAVFYTEEPLP